jgi:hypothetical protein
MATNPALTQQASRRRDDPAVTGLVTQGQQRRSAGLGRAGRPVRPHCFGPSAAATGWTPPTARAPTRNIRLKLVDQQDKIRYPAALPGWPTTTTRRECRIRHTAHTTTPAEWPQ